ncbi:MAG: hypothetical protein ABI112_03465 [Terracoccus sp.]
MLRVVRVVLWIRHFWRVARRVVRVVLWIQHFWRVARRVVQKGSASLGRTASAPASQSAAHFEDAERLG